MKSLRLSSLALATACCLAAMTSCSSDDEPRNDNTDKDAPMATEFQTKAEGKIWTPSADEQMTWVTTDGQVLTADELSASAGGSYRHSYHFYGTEATRFQLLTFGGGDPATPRAVRQTYTYDYDQKSGTATFRTPGTNDEAMSIDIESVSENRMVIHDTSDLRPAAGGAETAYRRVVLVPVDKSQEQTWWDTYVAV